MGGSVVFEVCYCTFLFQCLGVWFDNLSLVEECLIMELVISSRYFSIPISFFTSPQMRNFLRVPVRAKGFLVKDVWQLLEDVLLNKWRFGIIGIDIKICFPILA